jgi:hypothetical protein
VSLDSILLLLAFGCFVAAAFGVATKINLVAAGLALAVLSLLIVSNPIIG